jgi:MOSC domain-containing protein YiiM
MEGNVYSICISKRKGTKKKPVTKAMVRPNLGIEGDAHQGNGHRQVSLLAWERIKEACPKEIKVMPGIFAENITTKGIDLSKLKIGDKIFINKVVLEVTQIGKKCHTFCEIKKLSGKCIMPKEGIFAKCIQQGILKKGDKIAIIDHKGEE